MDPQRARPASPAVAAPTLDALFAGRKSKWLPLYRRLLARVSAIPGLGVCYGKTSIAVEVADQTMALIKVTSQGLELRIALPKAQLKTARLKKLARKTKPAMSHQVLLSEAAELDEELLTWLKAARTEARTAKRRSS